jgi:hypothetical protein
MPPPSTSRSISHTPRGLLNLALGSIDPNIGELDFTDLDTEMESDQGMSHDDKIRQILETDVGRVFEHHPNSDKIYRYHRGGLTDNPSYGGVTYKRLPPSPVYFINKDGKLGSLYPKTNPVDTLGVNSMYYEHLDLKERIVTLVVWTNVPPSSWMMSDIRPLISAHQIHATRIPIPEISMESTPATTPRPGSPGASTSGQSTPAGTAPGTPSSRHDATPAGSQPAATLDVEGATFSILIPSGKNEVKGFAKRYFRIPPASRIGSDAEKDLFSLFQNTAGETDPQLMVALRSAPINAKTSVH